MEIEDDGVETVGDKKTYRLSQKQKQMIEALKKNGGNISSCAESVGVGRTTHYLWLKNNPKYVAAYDEIGELILDVTESRLMQNINAGNQKAIEYLLDSKGKERGYGQTKRVEIGGPDGGPIQHEDVSDTELKDKLTDLGIGSSDSQLDSKRVDE